MTKDEAYKEFEAEPVDESLELPDQRSFNAGYAAAWGARGAHDAQIAGALANAIPIDVLGEEMTLTLTWDDFDRLRDAYAKYQDAILAADEPKGGQ